MNLFGGGFYAIDHRLRGWRQISKLAYNIEMILNGTIQLKSLSVTKTMGKKSPFKIASNYRGSIIMNVGKFNLLQYLTD